VPKRAEAEKALPAFDLKAARQARRITQNQAKELLCTSQASITRWEKEGTMPLIYRKYWELHWSTEDAKQSKTKPNVAGKSASDTKRVRVNKGNSSEGDQGDRVSTRTEQQRLSPVRSRRELAEDE
jgi:transcriptional regulator with XRE-family HTH domain